MWHATEDFNRYTLKLGEIVDRAAGNHRTDANAHLWDRFDDTLKQMDVARTGDHGRFLITAAERGLPFPIVQENLGVNPISNPEPE
jgi:hypothetical protein